MNKSAFLIIGIVIPIIIFYCGETGAASENIRADESEEVGLPDYPRIERFEQGSVKVDFPTIEAWPDFRYLQAWLPVEVILNDDGKPWVGSVHLRVATEIDFEQRTVRISDSTVLETRFFDKTPPQALTDLVSRTVTGGVRIVPLDVLLRLLPDAFEVPAQPGEPPRLNFEPPVIVVSETPLKLMSIDLEPVRAPVEGTELEYVINTNWNIFYSASEGVWYVLNDGAWQKNNYLADGGWVTTDQLPADFRILASGGGWQEVQQALPAQMPANPPTPFMVSLQATELVLLDGMRRLRSIDKTDIRYVSNTQSDLFNYGDVWYLLISGRWFSNAELDGQWQHVNELPEAFSQIPSDHDKAHVLYSVPGTRQAKLALLEASLPRRTSLATGSVAATEVSWVGEPRFEAIDTTSLQRGLNTPFQVIQHNNFYYLCYEGAWYFSALPTGPWQVAAQIPAEIYRIPATDPAYNVTFVRLDDNQGQNDETVNYSYTSGYTGSFSTRVSVVYGTGWHYPSNVFWGPRHMPAYWHHMPTYGYNTGWDPIGGYYHGRGGFYGPWGRSTTITIESPTVDYTHGYGSAWEGPYQTTPGDPSVKEDNSLEKFLPAKKADGTEKFVKTEKSEGGGEAKITASSLYTSSTLSSNMFSGPGGEVYKHEDEQWQQYSEGNWSTMQAMEQEYRQTGRPRQRRDTRTNERWLPAHKRTLSRSELDEQELARIEGMENYSKYRMRQEAEKR